MPEQQRSSFYSTLGRLSAIITIIPASMGGGWLFGHFVIDRYLGSGPWGGIACLLLGAAAGFYETFQILISNQGKPDSPPNDDH